MSGESHDALRSGDPYLQSPIDDIESFAWVLLYGIVRNLTQGQLSQRDEQLQDDLNTAREMALSRFNEVGVNKNMNYHLLTRTLSASGLLTKYEQTKNNLRAQWAEDYDELHTAGVHGGWMWELCYHAAAVGGLLAVLQILIDFKNSTGQK